MHMHEVRRGRGIGVGGGALAGRGLGEEMRHRVLKVLSAQHRY